MQEVSAALLAKLMGPALAMAFSPIPVVIALVILVHNDRPRASSIAYLAGRATALTAAALTVTGASALLAGATHQHLPSWTKFIAAAIGAATMVAGIRTWRRRSAPTSDPGWHRHIGGIRPPASAAIGLLPPLLNPKVLAASAAAGTQITALRTPAAIVTALGCYVAVATSTVAAPVLIYLLAGERIDHRLERVRAAIAARQNETTAVTLIGIGAAIIIYALARP